jgi:Domain of unknown function (DUF6894)
MPRYFFYLTNGSRVVNDSDGVEHESNESARLGAIEMVSELLKESLITGQAWHGWSVIVRNQNRRTIWQLKF